ncbi:hypothetical protein SNE40_006045 [Patella caerulea]|uniref:EGF-like domain-containing protein n=1 Tax=Patella caerulea TaxID=87958 RepID=A0AAN8K8T5_PATCE
MSTSLILVYLVVALTFSSCTAHRNRWWNSPRPAISLRRLHCDKVEQFDLCRCCPVDPCDAVECLNGGECIGDGVCQCVSGYSGPTCNIDPCDGVECLNGGQCVGEGVCNCTFGFGGANCNRRVCNVTECTDRSGSCISVRCTTDATNCGGNVCNTANNELCIDDTCVDEGDVCGDINGTEFVCVDTGKPCGEGFCAPTFSPNLCIIETCRFTVGCDADETTCSDFGGSCSDGVCLATCNEETDCTGLPCIGGFCADLKCGETICIF